MARILSDIISAIRNNRQTRPELSDLNGPLSASDYAVWEENIGYCHWLFENKVDALMAEIQSEIDRNNPGGDAWWHEKILEFQYDATNPQVVQEINFIAQYPVVDATLRIIARCSVQTLRDSTDNRSYVSIKVAKIVGGQLGPLSDLEMAALKAYSLAIRPSGVSVDIVSLFADRLKIVGEVYFDGQYPQSLIQTNVIAAINNYCTYMAYQLFNGEVKLLTLTDYVQQVAGVTDFHITAAYGRDQATAVGGATLFNRIYPTSAGYIIPEDTTGHQLTDTLTFTSV